MGDYRTRMSAEVREEFCARLIESDRGVDEVCLAADMPCSRTIYYWLARDEAFQEQYRVAREFQGTVQADRSLGEALDAENATVGRLRWDARRWTAAKQAPRKYGDKVAVDYQMQLGSPFEAVDLQAAARIAALLDMARAARDAAETQ